VRKSRPEMQQLIESHALIVRRGRILLEQSRHRWRGMWILPRLEHDRSNQRRVQRQRRPVYESVFPFTHHQVTLSVYRRRAPKRIPPGQRWFKSIGKIAMPSPHRRAIDAVLDAGFSVQHEQQKNPSNSS
jgi:hypothetical protein